MPLDQPLHHQLAAELPLAQLGQLPRQLYQGGEGPGALLSWKGLDVRWWSREVWNIRKASLFFGGRSEKRLGRSSPPQNGGIGGTMAL